MRQSDGHNGRVLPYFVARIATTPVDAIEALGAPRTVDAITEADALDRRIADARDGASAALHFAIGAVSDRRSRNALLQLRRDLFTGRPVSDARLTLLSLLPESSVGVVRELLRLSEERTQAGDSIRELYVTERAAARRCIVAWLADPAFRNGLDLSSATLARNAERYSHSDPARFDSRDEQIERGFVRYLTRAAMKATPFGTFCVVIPGMLTHAAPGVDVVRFDGDPFALRTVVRLSERLESHHSALKALAAQYSEAPIGARGAILAEMQTTVRASPSSRELPIYEDATADATLLVAQHPALVSALDAMRDWLARTSALAPIVARQIEMRHFFDRQYGSEISAQPLLEFFDAFQRGHVATQELDRHIDAASDRVTRLFSARWATSPNANEVNVSLDELASALGDVASGQRTCASTSIFCQVVAGMDATATIRVLSTKDHVVAGCGRHYGRFMYLMPSAFEDAMRRDNAALAGVGAQLAELRTAVRINADRHPMMTTAEIDYDGYCGGLALADIDVARDPDAPDALQLRQRSSGCVLLPIDLSLVNGLSRPPLFQLLTWFSPGCDAYAPIPDAIDDSGAPDDRVSYRPRFVYENQFVLSRRRWVIPGACFPCRGAREADHEYFVRMQHWRAEHGVDQEVFARVRLATWPAPDASSSREWWKPQFIDLASPVLVELFARLPGKLESFEVILEERYPNRNALPVHDGRRHAFELVLQVNSQ